MKRTGRRWKTACFLLLGTLLLSSCAYTSQQTPPASSQPDESQEQDKEPAPHEALRDQLISTLNLSRQPKDYIVASDNLDESAGFLVEIVMDDPSLYLAGNGSRILEDTLGDFAYAYLYSGTLSSAQVGRLALEEMQGENPAQAEAPDAEEPDAAAGKKLRTASRAGADSSLKDILYNAGQKIASLSVAWGENGEHSVWLLLVQARDIS